MIDFLVEDGDLVIDQATRDFARQTDPARASLTRLIELFSMTPGDDLDYPFYYSGQRRGYESSGATSGTERIQDATRIIGLLPEVDPKTIRVSLRGNVLVVSYRLRTGESVATEL